MDKSNELYFLNKYKYLNLSETSSGKIEEELSKEEKKRQKELKKKQMQELCQQKSKKVTNLAKVKKYIDHTKPGEKKDLNREFLKNWPNTASAWPGLGHGQAGLRPRA